MEIPDRAEVIVKITMPFYEEIREVVPQMVEQYGSLDSVATAAVMFTLLDEFESDMEEQGIRFEHLETNLIWENE